MKGLAEGGREDAVGTLPKVQYMPEGEEVA